ncbi:MAG: Panacea domain-containing protein [Dehalococcoidales bacterium]
MKKISLKPSESCNLEKLKELLLYIAIKSEKDARFGAIKLNKILFYSDFAAYRTLGHSISDAEYQNLEEGPAPRQLLPCRNELIAQGDAQIENVPYFNGIQQKLVANREPHAEMFTKEELDIVDQVIEGLWLLNGKEVSLKSHDQLGWLLTEEGETIPYSASYFSNEPLSEDQIEAGKEIAKKHDLLLV